MTTSQIEAETEARQPSPYNKAFLAKAIDRLQHLSILEHGLLAETLNDFVLRTIGLIWDDKHRLFWVEHPFVGAQVAVWMIPICDQIDHRPSSTEDQHEPLNPAAIMRPLI